jgi:hypothetical protein
MIMIMIMIMMMMMPGEPEGDRGPMLRAAAV